MRTRTPLSENTLDDVVGGLMDFNYNTNVLTFINPDNMSDQRTYSITCDFNTAYKYSKQMHAQNMPESQIISNMLSLGYIG